MFLFLKDTSCANSKPPWCAFHLPDVVFGKNSLSFSFSCRLIFSRLSPVSLAGSPVTSLPSFGTTHVHFHFYNPGFCFLSFPNTAISLFIYFCCCIFSSSELFPFGSEFFVWLSFVMSLFPLFVPKCLYTKIVRWFLWSISLFWMESILPGSTLCRIFMWQGCLKESLK